MSYQKNIKTGFQNFKGKKILPNKRKGPCALCKGIKRRYNDLTFKTYVFNEKLLNFCCLCEEFFYCEIHKTFDFCKNKIYECEEENCNSSFEANLETTIARFSNEANDDFYNYEKSPYHCEKHRYHCRFKNIGKVEKCIEKCSYRYVKIEISDFNFDLPIELKYIILEYFNSINGCGKH